MNISIFQVDAFTDKLFGGNPAAVCPLDEWLSDEVLMNIAKENNLAETAYFKKEDNGYHLRWFTPDIEMDLCGHATLASAHVIFNHLEHPSNEVIFSSLSGELVVKRVSQGLQMDFPSRPPETCDPPAEILKAFNIQPKEIQKSRDYFFVFENEKQVRDLDIDEIKLRDIDLGTGGIICTAKGDEVDFVSRFFTPGATQFEDPVTGSAHCTSIPYWAAVLGKDELVAHQISERLGVINCVNQPERVFISGNAKTYLQGEIFV